MEYLQKNTLIDMPFSRVTVEQAIKILNTHGIEADEEQTRTILKFLYILAKNHQISPLPDDE